MIIRALSDQHGNLPKVEPCDLLLIAGDVCPVDDHDKNFQRQWLKGPFSDWLDSLEAEHIVGIAGNHDFELGADPKLGLALPWDYLMDSETSFKGQKIYGMPWVPNLPSWAFYAPDGILRDRVGAIPTDTDILVTHGPPYGIGDRATFPKPGTHVGSTALDAALRYRLNPKLHVFGHIHEDHGRWDMDGIVLANVSLVDYHYDMTRVPMRFEVDKP